MTQYSMCLVLSGNDPHIRILKTVCVSQYIGGGIRSMSCKGSRVFQENMGKNPIKRGELGLRPIGE